jgi:hypothetical protein
MCTFVNAHLWKLDFVYAHIHKHAYTEVDFHNYGRQLPYMCIYESRISYMHASVNVHLRKLDFVYAHIWKPTSINTHLWMTDFVYGDL